MTTLAILKAELISDTPRLSSETAAVANKIAASFRYYNRKRFYFNTLDTIDLTAVVDQSRYETAAELVRVDAIFRVRDNEISELSRRFNSETEAWLGRSQSSGKPTDFAYTNKSLRIYPAPDFAYSLLLHGHFKIDPPATDSEADNPWMTEAYDLIKARTMWDLWSTTLQGADGTESAAYKNAELEALRSLEDETNMRNGTGEIVPTEF